MKDSIFSECELAYTNIKGKTVKKYVVIQQGFIAEEKERFHPTQKPVKLFEMILEDFTEKDDLILDCFSGSGTLALAAEQLNRKWYCIEREKKYCEITKKRIKRGTQQKLF